MKDLAIAKLRNELNSVRGDRRVSVIKQPVRDALVEFCYQSDEFAQAVCQGGTLNDCLKSILNGCGDAISDLEAYRRAVKFYFDGADIRFQMRIDLCASVKDAPAQRPKEKSPIVLEMFDLI